MCFVAVGDRLHGRRVFGRIGGNHLFHCLRSPRVLRPNADGQNEWRGKRNGSQSGRQCSLFASHKHTSWMVWHLAHIFFHDVLFAFLRRTSSRLLPKSLRITAAALRPGMPVTAPPGAVHAPVWYSPATGML